MQSAVIFCVAACDWAPSITMPAQCNKVQTTYLLLFYLFENLVVWYFSVLS